MIILKTKNHKKLRGFRKWTDLADWIEGNLPYGEYWAIVKPLANLTGIRKVIHSEGEIHVEGRGCI